MRLQGIGLGSDCYDPESGESITCAGGTDYGNSDGWGAGGPTYSQTGGGGSASSPSTGNSAMTALTTALNNIFGPILKANFGQPQLPPGTVLINGPNGSQMIRYANGQQVPYVPSQFGVGVSTTGSSSMILIVAAVAGIALLASRH